MSTNPSDDAAKTPAEESANSVIAAQSQPENPQHDPRVPSFEVEASHYDNGLTRPTEQSWNGFQTAEKAKEAIANLITWPPYCFRRIILQDLSNPEEPQYSILRDGPVKGGRKDAVFTLLKVMVDEPDSW